MSKNPPEQRVQVRDRASVSNAPGLSSNRLLIQWFIDIERRLNVFTDGYSATLPRNRIK